MELSTIASNNTQFLGRINFTIDIYMFFELDTFVLKDDFYLETGFQSFGGIWGVQGISEPVPLEHIG